MSVLYFKHAYPQARIIGFEPDPAIFPYCQENIVRNGLKNVQLVQAAVVGRDVGGDLLLRRQIRHWTKYEVPCVRLREYLIEPVDFLKMNIEGAEWEVLADSEDCLREVREMVIEYHHLPGLPRTLHKILELLHCQGFEYLVNDFGSESNGGVYPPFRLTPESRYYLLIYARRQGR